MHVGVQSPGTGRLVALLLQGLAVPPGVASIELAGVAAAPGR